MMPRPIGDIGLTPQEQKLYGHHLRTLRTGGGVPNEGGLSTVYQAVVGNDGKYYSIPTVWGGKIRPVGEAQDLAAQQGMDSWPSYPSPEAADARYQIMHQYMNEDIANAPPQLTTGPIQWDEQALAGAREQQPNRVLLDAMLMASPVGEGAFWMSRLLRNPLLRDLRLERMFRR